ncbi:MAG: DNA-binding protein [Candidatus Marsarchaeota archaeon]|jgi:programmed cell death protein 5|nr:DNA-binding protein [Candidatus Marsarchaeota archaeon]MCL5112448.1 DNA-binding protein [Candidatus Marsarchaeota archaeon]
MSPEDDQEDQEEKRYKKRMAELIKSQQLEQQKKEILRKFLDDEAYERVMNIRLTNNELYDQLVNVIISLAQNNRLNSKITNEQLKGLITRLTFKPETKIEFKRK